MIMSHDGSIKIGDILYKATCDDFNCGTIFKIIKGYGTDWVNNQLFIKNKIYNDQEYILATRLKDGYAIRSNTFEFDCEIIRI